MTPTPETTCPNPLAIRPGLCRCGCGKPTSVAKRNRKERGVVKGQPLPFYRFHEGRLNFVIDPGTGCWVWQGKGDKDGYGVTRWDYKTVRVHRAMYEQLVGPVPVGLVLDHRCDNPPCVNPMHLEPVTNAENIRRGRSTSLTYQDVADIRASSTPGAQLAREYGLAESTISRIRKELRWTAI